MIGRIIGHYKIIEKIGGGGMGEIYLADDLRLERKIAIKFLPQHLTKDKENVQRFEREAKAAASLNHPNIVTIHDVIEEDDQLCIVMEYVEGKSLREVINEYALEQDRIIDIITQICEGLSKAHRSGIIHRDIKPENIIIDKDARVKILDFGLAKLKGVSKLTKDTSTLGTVHYMSPEQVQGQDVDHRSDLWSVGVIFYELLTGEPPFKGEYESSVQYAILNEESQVSAKDISEKMRKIIHNCLQKRPQDRLQSMEIFLDCLRDDQKETKKDIKIFSKRNITLTAILVAIILIVYILVSVQPLEKKVSDSIAVLPLKNLSGNIEQEYFSDGMTEALITELSKLKSLKVISRTSIMQFKNTDKLLPDIAKDLDVDFLVEGSALIIGDQVKITAQLIDAEQDRHLWAEDYVRDMRNILMLHKEVASTIASQVQTTLLSENKFSISDIEEVNPKAYDDFLKGKFYLYKLTKANVDKAVDYFHSALKHQNDFALAYAGLAEAYNILPSFGWISSQKGWLKEKEMSLKALNIDNGLAEAHTMLAEVKYIYEWDWIGAEMSYKKAIEINPNYSTAHAWYAVFLGSMGRHEEAIKEIKIAQELDPLFYRPKVTAVNVYVFARQYKNAKAQLLQLMNLNPDLPITHSKLGWYNIVTGRYEDAILELKRAAILAKDSTHIPRLAQAYALKGNKIKARQLLDYWLHSEPVNMRETEVALVFLALGDREQAFNWLQKAYYLRNDYYLHRLKVDPRFDPVRKDKRFIVLLDKIGLNP